MCSKCYEKFAVRSGKIMLFCKLKDNNVNPQDEIKRLCICQRFCPDKDQYVPHRQKEGCRYYEDWME